MMQIIIFQYFSFRHSFIFFLVSHELLQRIVLINFEIILLFIEIERSLFIFLWFRFFLSELQVQLLLNDRLVCKCILSSVPDEGRFGKLIGF